MVWDILIKRRGSRKRGHSFWNRRSSHLCTLVFVVKKFHVEYFCFFIVFGDKKQLLKALLTCIFIPRLLNLFDLLSYSSESRKKYTLKLLLMFLEGLGECFPGVLGCWKKLWSLVKLFQRIWIQNLDQNLILSLQNLIMTVCTVPF